LPIEIWYYGTDFNDVEIKLLESLDNVKTRDLKEILETQTRFQFVKGSGKFFGVKGAALVFSEFDKILYLDSDNMPVTDPSNLFYSEPFLTTGAVFWKDFWQTHPENPIFRILEISCDEEFEQESGQILIDKTNDRVWKALNLAAYLQSQSDFYFQLLMGDKDTFKYAFRALGSPYHMVLPHLGVIGTKSGSFCGHTMVQFRPIKPSLKDQDWKPEILFLHINLLKYTNWGSLGQARTFQILQRYISPDTPNAVGIIQGKDHLCTMLRSYKDKEVVESALKDHLPSFDSDYHIARQQVESEIPFDS
jgi:hypothetical protein